jgi:threonine/homoserine/homoserine lactone efflux protein
VETGTLFHTIAAALGFSALLSASPLAFSIVKWADVVYLAVIGIKTILEPPPDLANAEALPYPVAYRRAVVTNVLNPKVALFFLAFLPQFVVPGRGPIWSQTLALGLVYIVLGLCSDSMYALIGARLGTRFGGRTARLRATRYAEGGILVGLGVLTLALPHRRAAK